MLLKLLTFIYLTCYSTSLLITKSNFDISKQLNELEFQLNSFEEETDKAFDALLFNTAILQQLKVEDAFEELLSTATEFKMNKITSVDDIMTSCERMYEKFGNSKLAEQVVHGLIELIPFVSETIAIGETISSTIDVACDEETTKCNVVKHASVKTGESVTNILWTGGTLFIGPLIGYVVGGIGHLVKDKDIPKAKACVACYLSSIMAKDIFDKRVTDPNYRGNSDAAILYKFKDDYVFPDCKFDTQPATDTLAAQYISERMDAQFKFDRGLETTADWFKKPGTTTSKLFAELSGDNIFQKAVKDSGVPAIQFLAKKFWMVIKSNAVQAKTAGKINADAVAIMDWWKR